MSWWEIFKSTFNEWLEDRASRLAAAVAYYAIFSIAPLLMIGVAIAGLIFGQKAASNQLRPELARYLGDHAAGFIQQLIAKAGYSPSLSFAGIISILLLLYAATNLFVSLQDALNTIFDVEPKPGRGIIGILKDRALSFVMVLLIGAFIIASTIFSTVLTAVSSHLGGESAFHAVLTYILSFVVSVGLFTGIFAMLFKFLPDIEIDWKDTLLGALTTSIIFNLARIGLGLYLGRSSTTGPFGAAGSLVVIMLFIYYTCEIMFLGAEFTQVWARRAGQPIRPSRNALSLDPAYTRTTHGVASPTNASGATGSRTHYDRTGGTARARSEGGRGAAAPSRQHPRDGLTIYDGGGRTSPGQLPTPNAEAAEVAQSAQNPDSPHYPASRYHPPLPRSRRGAAAELASAAALLAIPVTWLFVKRNN